jgi:hypothetical protein
MFFAFSIMSAELTLYGLYILKKLQGKIQGTPQKASPKASKSA